MHHVKEPVDLIHIRRDERILDAFEGFDILIVPALDALAPREQEFDAAQLRQTERCGNVADRSLQRRIGAENDRGTLLDATAAQSPDLCGEIIVVGDDHGAFAANQSAWLREVEDRTVAECPYQLAFVQGANGFRGIFNQKDASFFRQLTQRFPRRRMTVGVAGDNGSRLLSDPGFGLFRRQGPDPIIDVGEHRSRAAQRDAVCRFAKGVSREHDLGARTDAARPQRQQHSYRAAGDRDCMLAR